MHVDPIEKKPLFHFYPGSNALSLGSVGCTFRCLHCQNYSISMALLNEYNLIELRPEDVPRRAIERGCQGIAFTYNEPTIWHEFNYDVCRLAKDRGLYTAYVTNGYIQEAPLRELAPYLDAMNIDVKGFTERFYREVCKASLQPVLETVRLAHSLNIHIELTYLIIPGKNDTEEEIRSFAQWCAELDPRVPVHFTRFHPDYLLTDVPPTPIDTMNMAKRVGKEEGLKFIYMGNVYIPHGEDTFCPKCGSLLVKRNGFSMTLQETREGHCPHCGEDLYMVQSKEQSEHMKEPMSR